MYDIDQIQALFTRNADLANAAGMKAYMKNRFEFYGIQSVKRRELQRPFLLKASLPEKWEAFELIREFWELPQRELQYFGLDMIARYQKQLEKEDVGFLEYLLTHKSWWDTVDALAVNAVGTYLTLFPDTRSYLVESWLDSGNLWLQRTCLLYQLKYKENLDTDHLEYIIGRLNGGNEFFINKAIGWILREFGKTNPEWVRDFVDRVSLHPLSRREAMRIIQRSE